VVKYIKQATERIWMSCYTADDEEIQTALSQCARRGVHIRILADHMQLMSGNSMKMPEFMQLLHLESKVEIKKVTPPGPPGYGRQFRHMHAKLIIIDSQWVLMGSFNFTAAAKQNFECYAAISEEHVVRAAMGAYDIWWSYGQLVDGHLLKEAQKKRDLKQKPKAKPNKASSEASSSSSSGQKVQYVQV